MAIKFRQLGSDIKLYLVIISLLVTLAYITTVNTEGNYRLSYLWLTILSLVIIGLIMLVIILTKSLIKLYHDFKQEEPGSRLTVRLVSLFALLILVPSTTVYSFSIYFLQNGINNWFHVDVDQALDNSLELGRSALGIRMRTLLRQTRFMAGVLSDLPVNDLDHGLRELARLSGALELGIWNMDGQVLIFSSDNPSIIAPSQPNNAIFDQLRKGEDYIASEPSNNGILRLRAAVKLSKTPGSQRDYILHAMFPVNERLNMLGKKVQSSYADYKELSYLRKPLISIFILTLSLIILLAGLLSVWFAIWISRRIVYPLQELAEGTQAVASGKYNTQLSPVSAVDYDEINFLVDSFNQMTQRLAYARNSSQRSHRQLEQQTNYLSTILTSLSSGVITLDDSLLLKTANIASSNILNYDLQQLLDLPLNQLSEKQSRLTHFTQILARQMQQQTIWKQELILDPDKQQILMCHGTPLPNNTGWIVVFDDITALIQAQRNAAWGEVARRLAHEIKNPLTPIQLSAERLQYKYLPLLPKNQTDLLTKLTDTIIKQVEAMKGMVNDFADYARSSGLCLQSYVITELINEVLILYQHTNKNCLSLIENPAIKTMTVDKNRFRQALHNLIKNAIEAGEDAHLPVTIEIRYARIEQHNADWLELKICDYGPGIPDNMISILFEPYTTNKAGGTGLGLAVVKKIIEEHNGVVWAENLPSGETCITIRLPYGEC